VKRLLLISLLALPLLSVAQDVTWTDLPLPANPGSSTPSLSASRDGNIYAAWTEPTGENSHALRLARFDRENDQWSDPQSIAEGENWVINWADTPTITAGLRGKLAVTWPVAGSGDGHGYQTWISISNDHGETWSAPRPISTESEITEFAAVAPLLNGDWLAVWLDGRAKPASSNMQLYSRIIGNEEPDTLVDNRVCDCCGISTLVLPTGAVLVAYRDRSPTEVRDMAFASYSRGQWTPTPFPAADNWVIEGCPVNGASLSRRGAQIAVSWYTAADEKPLIRMARSTDIGRTWNHVTDLSDPTEKPRGAVSTVVLRDGSQWSSWVESSGAIALRGIDSKGVASPISRLTNLASAATRAGGVPRMVVLDNRSDQPARLLFIRTDPGEDSKPGRVTTHLASIATKTTSEPLDDCGCDADVATRGHGLRGVIKDLLPNQEALLVAHEEIPGVMSAMTMMFQVDPRVLSLVNPGQTILARMERRDDGKWWLFNIRLTEPAP
jgi:Cu/Ag efflux protein CusF